MAGPFTVVVLVVAGHAPEALSQALVRAAVDALGPSVLVDVRATPVEPDRDQAVVLEARAHAGALAELEPDDAEGRRVRLRVHVAASGRWLERQVAFEASDVDAERGRTLGYAIAAMLPLGEPSALPEPSAPPPASLPPVPAAPAPPTAPVAVAPAAEPKPKSTAISVQNPEPAQPVAGRLPSLAFELQGRAAIGFDATGFDAGGGLAVHWFAQPHVSVRVGIAVRGADVDPANGILVSIAGEAGVAWHPWRAVRGRPFGMSVRFDYLAMEQLLTPYHRENSALDGFIDGTFRFASDADFVLGLGVEQWLGVTYIENGRARIALPALRGVAESGLRLEF